jgi:hypothetical protein
MGKRPISATTWIAQSKRDLEIVWQPPAALRPNAQNARTHSVRQIAKLAQSLRTFGFVVPILVDRANKIAAGHGPVLAAQQLGLERVPTISLGHLSGAQIRAYVIADNRLAELAVWDKDLLRVELDYISMLEVEFDLTLTGFETAEINLLLDPQRETDPADAETQIDVIEPPVSRSGDLWLIGRHRLLCGDARLDHAYVQLLEGSKAQLVFTDRPLQRAHSAPCAELGAPPARRVRHGLGGDERDGVHALSDDCSRASRRPQRGRSHPLPVHGRALLCPAVCRPGRLFRT